MKWRTSLLLLYLLWSLYCVEVDCLTFPYVSFRGVALHNHAYVDLNLVGETTSGLDNDTIICHTNLATCCTLLFGGHRGEWFYPNGTILPPFFADIYKDAWDRRAYLLRRPNGGASGIYRCDITTVAAPDYSKGESVYVGLYSSGGTITMSGNMTFNVDSDLNGARPQFTLTCISTGGPATVVIWARDSGTAIGDEKSILDDATTAQYTHTLTVTGASGMGGLYTCVIVNEKPSLASATYTVQAASAPTNLMAVQEGYTSIRVSWDPPTPLGDTIGYRIYYSGVSSGSEDVSSITDNYLLTDLQTGGLYNISIVALATVSSQRLPSDTLEVTIALGALSVNVDSSSPTSLTISWTLNDLTATTYTISYSNTNTQCFIDSNEITTGITESLYTLTDLQEATEYSITVTAILSDGNTELGSLTSTTVDAVPSAAPTSVSASVTSSSITVHWGPVDCIHHNGDITGYSVRYRVKGNGSTLTMSVPGGSVTEASLPIVASSTTYSIEVAAVNSAGIGVYCDPITAVTTDTPNHTTAVIGGSVAVVLIVCIITAVTVIVIATLVIKNCQGTQTIGISRGAMNAGDTSLAVSELSRDPNTIRTSRNEAYHAIRQNGGTGTESAYETVTSLLYEQVDID